MIDSRLGREKARPGRWGDVRDPPVRPNGLSVMFDARSAIEHYPSVAERPGVKKLDVTEVHQVIGQQLVMRFEPQVPAPANFCGLGALGQAQPHL